MRQAEQQGGKSLLLGTGVLLLLVLPVISFADVRITLNNTFIEKYKNRATIDATYTVDMAHKKPNLPTNDGDLHIAGRAPEIGLPTVAEIMNAASQQQAVDLIHSAEGTGNPVKVSGAWRLWSEHGGTSDQVQGKALQPFDTTNPPHVFEIHPVTRIQDLNLAGSLKPIEGYSPKDAHDAFTNYENKRCKVIPGTKTTTIITPMAGYNYVEFLMEIQDDKQLELADGRIVAASVLESEGELLVQACRMIFIKDTPPEEAVIGLKKGDRLHVLGIPRIDLSNISWRIKNYKTKPDVLTCDLPYEIIIVGVYKD
jgi:hypothetical protein